MNRVPVKSSNLASVGYDTATELLEVEFRSGAVYRYREVPASIYEGLIATSARGESVGRYFDQKIKKAGFRFTRV